MKGFLKRLMGVILFALLVIPMMSANFLYWLAFGKSLKAVDKLFDWIIFDLMGL